MVRVVRIFILIFLITIPLSAFAQTSGYKVDVIENPPLGERTISVDMRVINQATKQDVPNLTPNDIAIYQDGQLLQTAIRLEGRSTGEDMPSINYGGQVLPASGATIGIVADLSSALNIGSGGADFIREVREAAEQWINFGNAVAPGDPEAIGLFIPRTNNSQALQPEGAPGFERDHNKIILALRQEAPRDGATDLYNAILAALEATSAEAQKRGTMSYVVIFSDGTINNRTDDPSSLVLQKAAESKTIIISVGIGRKESLNRDVNYLPRISDASGGRYIQVDPAAREETMKQAYKDFVKPIEHTAYSLSFNHTAPLDNKPHTYQIKVNVDGQEWASQVYNIPTGDIGSAEPLAYVKTQRWYLLRALPIAVVVAGLATFLATVARPKPTRIDPTMSQ